MQYVFLTACRNEARILPEFFEEFTVVTKQTGIAANTVLYMVDDLSTDDTLETLRQHEPDGWTLRIIEAPTNLGNQGAMFFGLQQIDVTPDDVLITFDCDGEDDVNQVPSILELGRAHPGKLVLIERGRRSESLLFKFLFFVYKAMFRFLTRRNTIPNNFMLIPGHCVPAIRRSPLTPAHLAYGTLKIGFPEVSVVRDRRTRYGGKTSQNLFTLMTHGMVGLMVFYEHVVAKLFMLLIGVGFLVAAVGVVGAIGQETIQIPDRVLGWAAAGLGAGAAMALALLLSSALVLFMKILAYTLSAGDSGRPRESTPQSESEAALGSDAAVETPESTVAQSS